DQLAQAIEEISLLEPYDQAYRVTRLGSGGISSIDSVPKDCFDDKTEVFLRGGWKLWKDVTENDEFACLIDGFMQFHKAHKLIQHEYDGEMYGADTRLINYLVTPNHRMW